VIYIEYNIKPIEVKKKYSLVIDQILELIKNGVFKVNGKLLPERIMAKKLGVSRPSVREAYSALEIVGILESKVGSGTYVKSKRISNILKLKIEDISEKEDSPYEIISVRKLIEPEVLYLATKNATSEDIAEIEQIFNIMKNEINDLGCYTLKSDALFHLGIAKASGNLVLLKLIEYIIELTDERLWKNIREKIIKTPSYIEHDIRHHENMVQCIKKRDLKNARKIIKKHFGEVLREFK